MDKWTLEMDINSDIWRGDIFNSRQEALNEGFRECVEYRSENFKIGIIEDPCNFGIDVDNVIEHIQEAAYEDVGEVAECYLEDATTEERLELEKELNDVFYRWQEKYNHKPTFYKVISEEIIEVVEI